MLKVLVAEDDSASAKFVGRVVEGMGHIGIICPNGKHALDTLYANPDIRIVISDIMMPELDGQTMIGLIRQDPRLEKLPIIIISAAVGVREIADLLSKGATWFLAKPVRKQELEEYVTRAAAFAETGTSKEHDDEDSSR